MPKNNRKFNRKNKKRKHNSDGQVIRAKKPRRRDGEVMGVVSRILGNGRFIVQCDDEKERMARIRGKLRKRMWIRRGDIVIVSPWDFEPEKCDILYRYQRREVAWLEREGYLSELLML